MSIVFTWNKYSAQLSDPISTLVQSKTVTNLNVLIGHKISLVYIPKYGGSNGTDGYTSISSYNMQTLGSGTIGTASTLSFSNVWLNSTGDGTSDYDSMLALIIDDDPNKCILYVYTLNDDSNTISGSVSITSSSSIRISWSASGSDTVHYRSLSITGWNYVQGSTSYGTVTSSTRNAYPDDGKSGDYWYTYVGSSISGSSGGSSKFCIGAPDNNSNTLLLLHGEDLTDSSSFNRPLSNYGATTSTTQKKFGSKSLYFDGSSYISVKAPDFMNTNGDFTIDWWQYRENLGTTCCINILNSAGYSQFLIQHNTGRLLYSSHTGTSWDAVNGANAFNLVQNTWEHCAIVKSGTTLTTYQNGVKIWSATVSNNFSGGEGEILIGAHANPTGRDYFKGYIDEFRISNVARWTAAFSVPTSAHSTDNSLASTSVARLAKKIYLGVENFEKKTLPSGYTQLSYIQSTGTQWINTGISPKSENIIYECEWAEPTLNSGTALFGSTNTGSSTSKWSATHYHPGAGSLYSATGATDGCCSMSGIIAGSWNHLKTTISNGTITREQNGVTTTASYAGSVQNATNIGLFADIRTSDVIEKGSFQMRYWKMWDNGVLVRDMVPCVNSTGTTGMYDTVNGVFYSNAGSGTFLAGSTTPQAARAVKKMYIGDSSNVAKLIYPCGIDVESMSISYTGAMTDQKNVVMDGKTYRLLTLTSSGTLNLETAVMTDIWMCGGGQSPSYYSTSKSGTYGGNGGNFIQSNGKALPESIVCTVGAGGSGVSSIDNISTANGTKGSGGGAQGYSADRWGDVSGHTGSSGGGVSTVPFLATSIFEPHCAGGGGGGDEYAGDEGDIYSNGGSGGTDGGAGGNSRVNYRLNGAGGAGGNKGGGTGGGYSGVSNGTNATYYGSGGGGKVGDLVGRSAGKGYQGVIYIRIPYEQGT